MVLPTEQTWPIAMLKDFSILGRLVPLRFSKNGRSAAEKKELMW